MKTAFYGHFPLRLTPDAIWITLARGFALHVNEHAEKLRHRFVSHAGQKTLSISRPDFTLGKENPWPEAFAAFSDRLMHETGGLSELIDARFSTTGPVERAVCHLMAMETFKAYFEYEMRCGCGIPSITLAGTTNDWVRLRERVVRFADFGLEFWIEALDPILRQFVAATEGRIDAMFWRSIFRYHGGSGPPVMTGWVNVLFPYLNGARDTLRRNPYLNDWAERLERDIELMEQECWDTKQGVGIEAVPACFTAVPLKFTDVATDETTMLRLVGGLLGVSVDEQSQAVQPEVGWVIAHEEPELEMTEQQQMMARFG